MPRIVLLGDSHLARVRRDLGRIGDDVLNVAVGGSSSRDLRGQAASVAWRTDDRAVLSVGSNDAAPWKQVPLPEHVDLVSALLAAVPAIRVYVAPPGVVEDRLTGDPDRTNAVMDAYRDAVVAVCEAAGVQVLRADRLLAHLGAGAFAADGLHLSGEGYDVLLAELSEMLATG
jgi:lysophospholipase L1-like esterase